MRCLFFTNTPAHVHLFRYAARNLIEEGHTIRFMARDYGCTLELLDYYELPYDVIGKTETNKFSVFKELPIHYKNFLLASRSFDPDIIFGTGAYPAHTGAVTGATTILVVDSEPTWINHAISKPFADVILTPHGFRKDLGPKQVNFKGFEECAYLHPEVYKPIDGVYEALGLDPDERYVLLRFNAWGSSHDFSRGGFSDEQRRELIERLAEHATVLVSDEGDERDESDLPAKSFDVHPALFHEALRNADLLVADTQTAVTEAALLGTPAIRSNTWVGEEDMGNFIELEENNLIFNLQSFDAVLRHSEELLEDGAKTEWTRRSEEYLSKTVNLTGVFTGITDQRKDVDRDAIKRLIESNLKVI